MGGGGYFINDRDTNVHCMLYDICLRAFLSQSEILVRNMGRTGTNFSRAVGNWYQFFTV